MLLPGRCGEDLGPIFRAFCTTGGGEANLAPAFLTRPTLPGFGDLGPAGAADVNFEHRMHFVRRKERASQMEKITITIENLSVDAELRETPTARKIFEALPLESSVNLWGDEIYFDIPLDIAQESDARQDVEVGDLAYWPAGPAFCIFFGPTPVSRGEQPRAYSAVNVFGRVIGDAKVFKGVSNGAIINVTRSDP